MLHLKGGPEDMKLVCWSENLRTLHDPQLVVAAGVLEVSWTIIFNLSVRFPLQRSWCCER